MDFKSKPIIFISIIVVAAVAAAGFWYWQNKKSALTPTTSAPAGVSTQEQIQENVAGGLGGSIFEKSQNPIVDKLPETNPFEKIEINPLKSIYANPFE